MLYEVITAIDHPGPVYIRVTRPPAPYFTEDDAPFTIGKANTLREGSDITLIATGLMVCQALLAAEQLEKDGISAAVINMHTIKPIDGGAIIAAAKKTGHLRPLV